jgi:Uma2 family endonuclease
LHHDAWFAYSDPKTLAESIMSTLAPPLPLLAAQAGFRRFSVPEYHRLIETGILNEDNNLELLEGYLVHKMSRNPPHDCAIQLLVQCLTALLPADWTLRVQSAVTLSDSEPEPDVAVVRGNARSYKNNHPRPPDVGLVIEVADATLAGDRSDKARIYARAGLPIYWILNLTEAQLETCEDPTGDTAAPDYRTRAIFKFDQSVPVMLDKTMVGALAVRDVLP